MNSLPDCHPQRLKFNHYENQVLENAASILAKLSFVNDEESFTTSQQTKTYLSCKLAGFEREVFAVMFLDGQHRLISYQEMFFGTINACAVYPREIVKFACQCNASAVILAHNHPSGSLLVSTADKNITEQIRCALNLIDVSLLDHVIVGNGTVSMAEQGLL